MFRLGEIPLPATCQWPPGEYCVDVLKGDASLVRTLWEEAQGGPGGHFWTPRLGTAVGPCWYLGTQHWMQNMKWKPFYDGGPKL